jgi:hypothetical protein
MHNRRRAERVGVLGEGVGCCARRDRNVTADIVDRRVDGRSRVLRVADLIALDVRHIRIGRDVRGVAGCLAADAGGGQGGEALGIVGQERVGGIEDGSITKFVDVSVPTAPKTTL